MNLNSTIKLAFRSLKRDKSFSFINIIGLSLGLMSCAFVFLYAFHSIRYDQYHEDYESIYRINSSWIGSTDKRSMAITAPAVGYSLAEDYSFIESVGILSAMNDQKTLSANNHEFELKNFRNGTSGVLDVFTFNLLSGTKTNTGVYLNEEWAIKLFGNIDCIGETVSINDSEYKISGVYENWPQNIDLPVDGLILEDLEQANRHAFAYMTYVKTTTDPATLQNALSALSTKLYNQEEFGQEELLLESVALNGLHFQESITGDLPKGNKTYTYLALCTGIILIVIVLINISNLSIIRGIDSIKMNGIRKILGASKKHVQMLHGIQLLILYVAATLIAGTLFQLISPYFTELTGILITSQHLPTLVGFALFFMALILLIGIYSDYLSAGIQPIHALKNQVSNSLSGGLLRKSLVIVQFVITGLILSGLFILLTQWEYIQSKDLGFSAKNIAVISLQKPGINAQTIKTNLSTLVGEENISLGTFGTLPGSDIPFTTATIESGKMDVPVNIIDYDPNFLDLFDIQLLEGNMPTNNILASGSAQPVLINQAFSKLLEKPMDSEMKLVWMKGTVAGIIADYHYQSLHNEIEPLILIPQGEHSRYTHVFVKVPMSKAASLQVAINEQLDPSEYKLEYLDQKLLASYRQEKEAISLIFYFALISLFISLLGVVGVVSFILKKREFEIGIRKVLGADLSSLCALFGSEVLVLLSISGIICLPLAYLLKDQILGLYAFQVALDWWYLLLPSIVIIITAMAVVFFQIIKGSQVDPVQLLKND